MNYPELSAENNSALDAAFDAWARQNDPRTYPAERQAFEAGWSAAQQDASTGHGHVFPRPDGMKMKCGGPGICQECSRDAAQKAQQEASAAQAVPELTSRVVNEACWKFIDAMPHPLTPQVWNNLKPALYAAVVHVLTAQHPTSAPDSSDADLLRKYIGLVVHCEGIDFLSLGYAREFFTPAELERLSALSEEDGQQEET